MRVRTSEGDPWSEDTTAGRAWLLIAKDRFRHDRRPAANGGVKPFHLRARRRGPMESRLKTSERRRLKTGDRRTRCRSRNRRPVRCSGSKPVPQTWSRNRYNDTRRSAYGNLDSSLRFYLRSRGRARKWVRLGSFRLRVAAGHGSAAGLADTLGLVETRVRVRRSVGGERRQQALDGGASAVRASRRILGLFPAAQDDLFKLGPAIEALVFEDWHI